MNLRAVIESHEGKLTRSDRKVVQHLLSSPAECAFLTASDLAKRAGVHTATAVRLAKKLGFAGYPELRDSLRDFMLENGDPHERMRRQLDHDGSESILSMVVERDVAYLNDLPNHVSQADVDAAARILLEARQVVLFGVGTAVSLTTLMERRLRRLGLIVVPAGRAPREAAEAAAAIGPGDAFLAFAFHTVPNALCPFLEHAGRVGARRILIADMIGPLVRPAPDVLLAAPRGVEEEFQTQTVPMAICNAVVLTLSRLAPERTLAGLSEYTRLRQTFFDDRQPLAGATPPPPPPRGRKPR